MNTVKLIECDRWYERNSINNHSTRVYDVLIDGKEVSAITIDRTTDCYPNLYTLCDIPRELNVNTWREAVIKVEGFIEGVLQGKEELAEYKTLNSMLDGKNIL